MFTRAQLDTFTDQQLDLLVSGTERVVDSAREEPDPDSWFTADEAEYALRQLVGEQRLRAHLDEIRS